MARPFPRREQPAAHHALRYSRFLARHRLHAHEVLGDAMAPTLLAGDIMLVRPADDFLRDGIYLVGLDASRFYRVGVRICCDALSLSSDNAHYPPERVTRSWFRENVLGIAAFRISALDDQARSMLLERR